MSEMTSSLIVEIVLAIRESTEKRGDGGVKRGRKLTLALDQLV